jgi:hypothetical protein
MIHRAYRHIPLIYLHILPIINIIHTLYGGLGSVRLKRPALIFRREKLAGSVVNIWKRINR